MKHDKIVYSKEIWNRPRVINKRWIVVTFKNGDTVEHNADYVEKVEYIEDE